MVKSYQKYDHNLRVSYLTIFECWHIVSKTDRCKSYEGIIDRCHIGPILKVRKETCRKENEKCHSWYEYHYDSTDHSKFFDNSIVPGFRIFVAFVPFVDSYELSFFSYEKTFVKENSCFFVQFC